MVRVSESMVTARVSSPACFGLADQRVLGCRRSNGKPERQKQGPPLLRSFADYRRHYWSSNW